ncbi:MAG: glucose-6-phosphate dehydrogenase [Planctomycetes bacterium]|nr:glucose-6-phosphate dehydrogenase [Planctomycetota bacterium]
MSEQGSFQVTASAGPAQALERTRRPDPCTVVIFGAAGDLTQRKIIPALYNLCLDGAPNEKLAVIGFARKAMTRDEFRTSVRETTGKFSRRKPDETVWPKFSNSLDYITGAFDSAEDFQKLKAKLAEADKNFGTAGNRVFYLSTPANMFPPILQNLKAAGLIYADASPGKAPWSRVIIEKPFGTDLATANELQGVVDACLDESQCYRIDHYLGKETVQNVLVLRYGNSIFEELWNRKYIDHVEITAAEELNVGNRARFYDQTGVIRDIVQNHLFQVMTLVAMEAPVSFAADEIRDEKAQVLRSLRPLPEDQITQNVVIGQYKGYHAEEGVKPGSRTPTYVAMKVMIDNWRWQGVPFYLRAGKCMTKRLTEVAIHFRQIPLCLFGKQDACQIIDQNVLAIRIQPDEGISLRFVSKVPGDELAVGNVLMDMSYSKAFNKAIAEAYERLIVDCMRGDATLFARSDEVNWSWRFCSPLIQALETRKDIPIPSYERGTAGPMEADKLIARDGRRWRSL